MSRIEIIKKWIKTQLNHSFTIELASSDASFRRYLRVISDNKTFILMDAPPDLERINHFINITNKLINAGINSPKIFSFDTKLGLILMTDFGSQTFLDVLDKSNAYKLYSKATHSLLEIQTKVDTKSLVDYSGNLLISEMSLFIEWYLKKLKNFKLEDQDILSKIFLVISDKALAQNKCFVHRDYHSRNLMYMPEGDPGILDYQDAVTGPLTYDLVSLL